MPRRRARFRYSRESTVEIDDDRLHAYVGPHGDSVIQLEKRLVKPIEEGDWTIETMAREIGKEETYDRYADIELDVEIEQLCEKHNWWYALHPAKLAYCSFCKSEERAERERKASEKKAKNGERATAA